MRKDKLKQQLIDIVRVIVIDIERIEQIHKIIDYINQIVDDINQIVEQIHVAIKQDIVIVEQEDIVIIRVSSQVETINIVTCKLNRETKYRIE